MPGHVLKIIRIGVGKNSTLGHLYLNGLFLCYLLEDRMAEKKAAGLTCIPEGNYRLVLNTTSGMHRKYLRLFPDMHQGMLQIAGIPDFDLVFLHIGNTHGDTRGCPLMGHRWIRSGEDYQVYQSAHAYRKVHPVVMGALQSGVVEVQVINHQKAYGNQFFTN